MLSSSSLIGIRRDRVQFSSRQLPLTVAPNSLPQSASPSLGNRVASVAHIFVLGLILKFSCALFSQRPDYSPRFGMSRGAMISLVTTQTSLRQGQGKVRDAERCTWQGQSILYCSKLEAVTRPKKLTDSFTRSTVGLTCPSLLDCLGLSTLFHFISFWI